MMRCCFVFSIIDGFMGHTLFNAWRFSLTVFRGSNCLLLVNGLPCVSLQGPLGWHMRLCVCIVGHTHGCFGSCFVGLIISRCDYFAFVGVTIRLWEAIHSVVWGRTVNIVDR